MKVKKTSICLAGGRELSYCDEHPGTDRDVVDTRDLGRATTRSEIRHDPLLDEWVVVASHRQEDPPASAELCPVPLATWHQAPVHGDRDLAHLRLEIFSIRRAANS